MENFVQLQDITKIYKMGEIEIRAVDGIDFTIHKGEFVVIVGPSLSLIHIFFLIFLLNFSAYDAS